MKKHIREPEKYLEFSRLKTMARDMITDKAEEYLDIPIQKTRSQVATKMAGKCDVKVVLAHRLFGHCRQAFYQ